MNLTKIILYGITLWVFLFVIISVIMFIPALIDDLMTQKVLVVIAVGVLTLILGGMYFKKHPARLLKGMLVGFIWAVVSMLLDVVITVPVFVKPKGEGYREFYADWSIWAGLGVMIILAGMAAILLSKKDTKAEKVANIERERQD